MSPDSHRAAAGASSVLFGTMDDNLPSAEPLGETDATASSSLSQDINAATHELHGQLNSAIQQAMPHGFPPEAHTPALYAHGLAEFVGTPYTTFEDEWTKVTRQAELEPDDLDSQSKKAHRKAVLKYLARVRPAGLERTPRIRRDLSAVGVDPTRRPNSNTVEQKYEKHIRASLQAKPHLLLAYGWTMYMAIFAGGRFIRQALSNVPDSFWDANDSNTSKVDAMLNSGDEQGTGSPKLDRPGYTFLSFDGTDDGVSIANAFREQFAKADALLTHTERDEIVKEARTIFQYCIALVKELNEGSASLSPESMAMTYEDAERVVDQEKRMLMQALQMGDPEEQPVGRQRTSRRRMFLVKAVVFGILWTLFFGRLVTWLTDKTPQRD